MRAVSEGLPVNWQELSYQDDIIAGAEFLSIFLRSRLQEAQMAVEDRQRGVTTTLETILDNSDNNLVDYPQKEHTRQSRSTSLLTAPISQPYTVASEQQFINTVSTTPVQEGSSEISNSKSSSLITPITATTNVDKTISAETTVLSTTEIYGAIVSEERPSIFAESNKSDFSVEESEPIARTTNVAQEYASTETTNNPNASPLYSTAQRAVNQQNFVYHNYPENGDRGRSVAFSSVIQELPQQTILSSWNIEKPLDGDYKAVTYHSSNADNGESNAVLNNNNNHTQSASGTTNTYYNDKPSMQDQDNMMKTNDDDVEQQNSQPGRETNWQLQTNVYSSSRPTSRGPIVYGKPEQNYEVDESVSIMTNGRTHGVQTVNTQDVNPAVPPSLTDQKPDNNAATDPNGQKVGYVVEGRNFRKYRVEERTSDGFIVGEYGVVSHNDGSLRGVRYTADSTINPRVIYDALMKFLSL